MRVLFLLKKNELYNVFSYCKRSSGLWNSVGFVAAELRECGVVAELVECDDNNDIDREVTKFRPDLVVIEALWVVPEKFDILKKLHPRVKWALHMHSHMPFLALEGIAMRWVIECAHRGLMVIANSPEAYEALSVIVPRERIVFLPNCYDHPMREPVVRGESSRINVGCFGAMRPLKNHLLQALAAIAYAKKHGKHLYYHVNGSRIETGGDPVLKNLIELFDRQKHATLVLHPWHDPERFMQVLHDYIDIGMQVSLSETFNIVTADYVASGLPIVVSKEIKWASWFSRAQDDSLSSIVAHMERALCARKLIRHNQKLLKKHNRRASKLWRDWVFDLLVHL